MVTCIAYVFGDMYNHNSRGLFWQVRYWSFLFLIHGGGTRNQDGSGSGGGRWNFTAMEGRVRGSGGVMSMFDFSEVHISWCGMGGMDRMNMKCVDVINAVDDAKLTVWASVLENSGAQAGSTVRVQNTADANVSCSLLQHGYSQVVMQHRSCLRLSNSTLWNHTDSALWALQVNQVSPHGGPSRLITSSKSSPSGIPSPACWLAISPTENLLAPLLNPKP